MSLKQVAELVRSHFFRWGWLIPAFLPLTSVAGRGAFNIASAIYFLWALASVLLTSGKTSAIWQQRWFLAFYGLMLLIWGLSLTQSADPRNGGYQLLRYLQFSLTGVFTLVALQQMPFQLPRLMRAMAWGSLTLILVLYLQLPYFLLAVEFIPTQQLHEDDLPWLLPFLLLAILSQSRRRWLLPCAIVAFAVYIGLSQGRAALLAMMAALAVFSFLGLHLRKRHWLAAGVAVVALGIVFGQRFFRGVSNISFDFATMDRFTNGRATIWWQALNSPPENHWLGVGFGNIASRVDVLRIADLAGIGEVTVRHLHNFILDAWFETGILGLSTFLAMLGVVLARVLRAWPGLGQDHRRIAAAALAGVVALLTAGLLSFSYTSKQFALYLYLLLAVLLALPQNAWAEGGLPRNHKDG
ncbi:MAG: O-antigen ligase family protein [Candidatus Dechloromonas phosphoritropha]